MYKPNKQLREILVACVKPECLQKATEALISNLFEYNDHRFAISGDVTTTGEDITLFVSPKNFDEVLECGKWYPREKFDDNPCDYILIEVDERHVHCAHHDCDRHTLWNTTTHFMYIKKP